MLLITVGNRTAFPKPCGVCVASPTGYCSACTAAVPAEENAMPGEEARQSHFLPCSAVARLSYRRRKEFCDRGNRFRRENVRHRILADEDCVWRAIGSYLRAERFDRVRERIHAGMGRHTGWTGNRQRGIHDGPLRNQSARCDANFHRAFRVGHHGDWTDFRSGARGCRNRHDRRDRTGNIIFAVVSGKRTGILH